LSVGRPIVALIIALATGCAERVETTYEPRTALQPETASAHKAARFYDQDIVRVFNAGGRIIGNLEAQGNVLSSPEEVDTWALEEAAARGGTHLIRTKKDVQAIFLRLRNASIDTSCGTIGTVATSTYQGSTNCVSTLSEAEYLKLERPRAEYVVVVVPCTNWGQLPEVLRPVSYEPCVPEPGEEKATPSRRETTSPRAENPAPPVAPSGTVLTNERCQPGGPPTSRTFLKDEANRAFSTGAKRSVGCRWGDRSATIFLTFRPSGCVQRVEVEDDSDDPHFTQCLLDSFADVTVPPFSGDDVRVSKRLGAR
jgi:hypothetical protein